jgi:YidC/Oxa1 family membrane protein insertase
MAASQKYMAYIVPLFALSGLYWAFGLVMYWVTTNVWTLGQQYVLFKRYPMPTPAGADGPAALGGAVTAKPIVSGKVLPAKPSAAAKPPAAGPGRAQSARKPSGGVSATGASQAPANGSGVLRRLSRRAEPEPPPPQPETKLVRQQPARRSRKKRSGKR